MKSSAHDTSCKMFHIRVGAILYRWTAILPGAPASLGWEYRDRSSSWRHINAIYVPASALAELSRRRSKQTSN